MNKKTTGKAMPERYYAEASGIVVDGRYGKDGKLHPVKTPKPKKDATKK